MDKTEASADPAIVAAWVAGWALSRGLPPPIPISGGLRVDVGRPDQRVRFILPRLDMAAIRHLTATENMPHTFLKVCAEPDAVAPLLPAGWTFQERRHMMTKALRQDAAPLLAAGYALDVAQDGAVVMAVARDETGTIAASGRVAVCGAYAVIDQIETAPNHRRKRLGTAVMDSLEQAAFAAGARRGLLVATPDGFGLYMSLRWEVHSPYSSVFYP